MILSTRTQKCVHVTSQDVWIEMVCFTNMQTLGERPRKRLFLLPQKRKGRLTAPSVCAPITGSVTVRRDEPFDFSRWSRSVIAASYPELLKHVWPQIEREPNIMRPEVFLLG